MGKFRFQRKHILPLVLLVICLALTVLSICQARRIDAMEDQVRSDLAFQMGDLLYGCDRVLNNTANPESTNEDDVIFLVQLQDLFQTLNQHENLCEFSKDNYSCDNFSNIFNILAESIIILSCYDSLSDQEQETFHTFLTQLVEQIRLAFSYEVEATDITQQHAYINSGWKQLDQYMEEDNIWNYFLANISGLGQ